MNQREKRLLIAFMSVAVIGLAAKYAKPVLIDPLLNSPQQVRIAQRQLDDVAEEHDELEAKLRDKYISYVERTKTTNPDDARDDLYDCISGLVRDAKLRQPVITPKDPRPIEKRSNVYTIQISMSAIGSFRQSIDFVRMFYRIPYIARFNSLKLEPTSARQRRGHDEVKLTGEIEVLVLPDEKSLDLKIGKQPDFIKKFSIKQLTQLKNWKPFTPYQKPTPPSPKDKIKKSTPTPPPPPPKPPGPPEWPDASEWMLKMVLRYGVDEVRLANIADDSTMHVAVGEEFDGGTLVLVTALGVVNLKEDYGYYVYPLGQYVSDAIPLGDADDWPEIQVAMLQYFDEEDRRIAIEEAERDAQAAKRRAMGIVDDDAEDEFVGPPDEEADDDADEATSNGMSVEDVLAQMGLDIEAPDGGSNGVESDEDSPDVVDQDTTSTGLAEESEADVQPPSPGGVKTKAGSNGSNDIKGRRRTPRSFRSRSTPGPKPKASDNRPATPDKSIGNSDEDTPVRPRSNSNARGASGAGKAKPKQTDPQ